jgi:putative lipoic acid-binding regulatory protein
MAEDNTTCNEETLLTFPCDIGVKVMGKTDRAFTALVFDLLAPFIPQLQPDDIAIKTSGKGNYQSLTVNFTATSKAQLDTIYQALSDEPLVLMTL